MDRCCLVAGFQRLVLGTDQWGAAGVLPIHTWVEAGRPLSPTLLVIGAEALSRALQALVE